MSRRWCAASWLDGVGNLRGWRERSHSTFMTLRVILEGLLQRLGLVASYEPAQDPYFHLGRCATVVAGGVELGVVGEVNPTIVEGFNLKSETVAFFELYLDAMLDALPKATRSFASLARFPAANRDLALVVPAEVPAGKVQGIITRHRLVDHVDLFDIYTGENVPPGTKSLAFHLYFQAQDRTLTTDEVNRSLQGLLRTLEREVQASLRG